ncbi:DUF2218 domain-containing protein [Streptomyces sp. NPDC004393]|jgi:hypothetical protein
MPTAEAHLATDRASRYLVQLCRHLGRMTRMSHRPLGGHGEGRMMPEVRHVDYTNTHGTVDFADGRWTLDATADTLTLRVDADDEQALRRLQDGIAARIEKIGRRDGLQARWRRVGTDTLPQARRDAEGQAPSVGGSRGPRGATSGLMAGGALIVAVHLGIGGAALADAKWTGWAANAVLVLILVKLLFLGSHLFLGRAALRRGIVSRHRSKHRERAAADAIG